MITPQVSNAAAIAEHSSHFRKTRRGHVLKIVEETYLRSDLGLGSRHGKTLDLVNAYLSYLSLLIHISVYIIII